MAQADRRQRLPIKLDTTSNGEFVPVPLGATNGAANRLAHENASGYSQKTGNNAKKLLVSACGAASTLLAFNAANAAAGKSGGYFDIRKTPRSTCSSRGRRSGGEGRIHL